jgi:serine/threonine-protein kinase
MVFAEPSSMHLAATSGTACNNPDGESNMSCPQDEMLLDFTSGSLHRDTAVAIETHIDGCSECRGALSDLARGSGSPGLGRYRINTVLGTGGMGIVYQAWDPQLARPVAVKALALRPDKIGSDAATQPLRRRAEPEVMARFMREARIQARLDHPAIVPVYELHDTGDEPYFVMKQLAGTTLHEVLAERPRNVLLRAFVDACLAIEFAHTRGVIHRDLKPANIMLGDFGEVYVLDWGIACVDGDASIPASFDDIDSADPGTTVPGTLLGTPGYIAPEYARGQPIGPPADVYALGCILFEILTGTSLHPHGLAGISSTIANPAVAPSVRAPDRTIPPELDAACMVALSADPAERPTARALGDRIQHYLDGDRDLERRRELAAEFLAQANAATGHADRMRLAGRALALDPESQQAAALITRMMLEPPAETPPEVERNIGARDVEYVARSSRMVMITAGACSCLFVPLVLWMGVSKVPVFAGACVLIVGLFVLTYLQTRVSIAGRRANLYPALVCSMVITATISRLCGPFLVVPLTAIVMAATIITQPQMLRRPVLTIVICAMGFVAPLVLEALGVLDTTWRVDQDRFVFRSTVVHFGGVASEVFLIVAPVFCIVVAGTFSWAIAKARRDAEHQLELQSWRLMQLVPESVRR